MSKKNNRNHNKKPPAIPSILKEEKEAQTDELIGCLLNISLADNNDAGNVPTTSTSPQDLTKEQLIARLICSQSLCKRFQNLLVKEQNGRDKDREAFQQLFHNVKVLLHDHRHAYSIIKASLTDSAIAFVNRREELRQKIERYQEMCQKEKREMKDALARNDVTVLKASAAIESTKNEISRVLELADKAREEAQNTKKEKKFLEKQNKELVEKQNKKYVTSETYCPKCSATKQCLNEIMDETKKLRIDNASLDKENRQIKNQKNSIEMLYNDLKKNVDKIVYERDIYKKDDKILREQLTKAKKALSETSNSPNRNSKVLESLISPARLENSPISQLQVGKDTPTKVADKSPTPPERIPSQNHITENPSEIVPKKRVNGERKSREDGEVTTPEDDAPSPSVKLNDRKRPLSPKSMKQEKPKQQDTYYIINDREKPGKMLKKEEPRPLSLLEVQPSASFPPPPMISARHQSPPYRYGNNPSYYPPPHGQQGYYDDHRMMQQQHQRPQPNYPHPHYAAQQHPRQMVNPYSDYPPQYAFRQPMPSPNNHHYRPAVNGGPAPWHDVGQSNHHQQHPPQQQQNHQNPRGESWTGWR